MGENLFELPVAGATGYVPVQTPLYQAADLNSEKLLTLAPGDGFLILAESGDWWQVQRATQQGYVRHDLAMINLPDVILSIMYDLTNAESSRFVSLGKPIPGITGQQLFTNRTYNPRLGRTEFIAPLLYPMAQKIQRIQRQVWANGETLKIYEAFRPYSVQQQVCTQLAAFADQDPEIKAGISSEPWDLEWFIADDISNHQIGYAMDVTLATVDETTLTTIGDYQVHQVTRATEAQMYTAIHELSRRSAVFTAPVWTGDRIAWRHSQIRSVVDPNALRLQKYCTDGGLTPLASEWWHFNDLDAYDQVAANPGDGNYLIHDLFSQVPHQ